MTDAAARAQTDTEAGTHEPDLRVPFSAGGEGRAFHARGKLCKLIAVKLTLDLLFVLGLAVYTYAVTFEHGFDGELEYADGSEVRGWVVDLEQPGAPVEVQLFVNGHFEASAEASEPASLEATADDAVRGRRGFVFRFGQRRYGEWEVRVYAVREGRGGARRTLQQIGGPGRVILK